MKKIFLIIPVFLAAFCLQLFAATCTVSGTITMPASSSAKNWTLVIDNDWDAGNGTAAMLFGSTTGTNQIIYNAIVPDGTYLIYAIVDETGNGGPPDNGDYVAIYGATWPSVPGAPNAAVVCPGGGVFDMIATTLSIPTPTPTPTVGGCSIDGTITLPLSSNGKQWSLIVDNDLDGGNGWVAATGGTTNGTNQYSYNISVGPGTYYIYSIVDENGSGGPPDAGDYVAMYGAIYPSMPGAPNAVVGPCPGGGTFDMVAGSIQPTPTMTPGGCTIDGTVTLPAPSSGKMWFVLVDNDTNGDSYLALATGITDGTDHFSYNISIGPGTYYIYAGVDEMGTGMPAGPEPGDYVAFYGAVFPAEPGAPNAVVGPCPGGGTFDMIAGMKPFPAATFTQTPTITPGGPTATFTPTSGISTVSGTITMPAVSSGKDVIVILDDDNDGGNGYLFSWTGTTGGTNQFAYSMTATTGTYYLFCFVDENLSGMGGGPDDGDYAGFYGGGPGWYDSPGAANAVVTFPSVTFDFPIVLIQPPTPTNTSVNTATRTCTVVNTATNTPVSTATNTPVNTATNTPVNTVTNTPVNTATNTPVNTASATASVSPSNTYTGTPTNTPVVTPTNTPMGEGIAVIDPTQVTAGASGQTMTITYTSGPTSWAAAPGYGTLKILVPAGWSPPSNTGGNAGYFTVAVTGGILYSKIVSGMYMIIQVRNLAAGGTITVTYGDTSLGGPGATVQGAVGTAVFITESSPDSDSTLPILNSPQAGVIAPTPTYTPSATASPTATSSSTPSPTNTVTLTWTDTFTQTATGTVTDSPTETPYVSPSNTPVDTETSTPEDTLTQTVTLTLTLTYTFTATPTLYLSPTVTPTAGQPNAAAGKSYCYPQPATGSDLYIVYSLTAAETVTIKIYNFAGIPVASETDAGHIGDDNTKYIGIKKFSPGIYYYLIRRSGKLPLSGKFLVVK